jgi:hypothetical protein
MALVKCKECGEQVSSSAKSCPKCGAKPPKQHTTAALVMLVFIGYAGYAAIKGTLTKPSVGAASAGVVQSQEPVVPDRKSQWEVLTSVDKMTGVRKIFAISPTVAPTERMDSPYQDVTAWLGVGCDGKSEWAYAGFSTSPNLTDTDTEDGYNKVRTRIKWDGAVQNVTLIQKWGSKVLNFDDERQAIPKMAGSNSALLELSWYGQSHPYFSFPMDGAAASIAEMRKQCSVKG